MTLYTAKAIAEYLDLTDRQVRKLRDRGVLKDRRPGLFELKETVRAYVAFIRQGDADANDEKARLMQVKRKTAEMNYERERGALHETADIELALRTLLLNMRTRFLAAAAKLAPELAKMGTNQAAIYDRLRAELVETLEQLADYETAFAARGGKGQEGNGAGEGKSSAEVQLLPVGGAGEQRDDVLPVSALRGEGEEPEPGGGEDCRVV